MAQRELYERFGATMMGICCRYVRDRAMAEDLLHDGFITVYTKIGEYRGDGSFEGWVKRIFVNTALGHLRKRNPIKDSDQIDNVAWLDSGDTDALEKISADDLRAKITSLPDGYRTILNLYAVEGYSHKEIGQMMGISENTSRSQYFRARGKLVEMIAEDETPHHNGSQAKTLRNTADELAGSLSREGP